MKKIVLIAVVAVFTLSSFAKGLETDYVVTKDGITYFQKVTFVTDKILIAKDADDNKIKFSKDEILSYRMSGEVYEQKQIGLKEMNFLKLLTNRNDLSILVNEKYIANGELEKTFYVYKGETFVLEINQRNVDQVLAFFER